ncbi:MAG TPA: phosphoribosyl-AMP cyclohydrolase [Cyanobacteria bacterium UBA8156]|nr:phosphoribosyl-AMP cyclohydrolase [Cyanobacteria bacterium UBA8156]
MDWSTVDASVGLAAAPSLTALLAHLKFDAQGLIPAIAQDANDGQVLMVAWMNATAIAKTLETGEVHYWSRSRQELWHKGATSGCTQKLQRLWVDCDADVLLLAIEQRGGAACHTGARSCFYREIDWRSVTPPAP